MNYDCDHGLFLALNFDGSPAMDRLMTFVSGPFLQVLIGAAALCIIGRRTGWRNLLLFVACVAAALALGDMLAGIFKHSGPLKHLWPDFPPRLRPMFTPSLEGLEFTADSLVALRRACAPGPWAVHVPAGAVAGLYGTVSSHAAVITALATLTIPVIRRRWFTVATCAAVVLVCYSRIYLAKHFPIDLLLGAGVGLVTGWVFYLVYHALSRRLAKRTHDTKANGRR